MNRSHVMSILEKLVKPLGYKISEQGNDLIVEHSEAPIFIRIHESGSNVLVQLDHGDIKDYVRDIIDTEDNPREYIEDVLDEMGSLVVQIAEALRKEGLNAIADTRSAAMDVLEELEEAEGE